MTSLRILAAFALAASTAAPVAAQAKSANITHFTPANVMKALTELGVKDASTRKQTMTGGQQVDVVSFTNGGLKHVGILAVCSAKGCLGLQLMTVWGQEAGKTISRTAINNYNANYTFGKGFVGPGNALVYSRYAISDGGVSIDNLKSNIANFANGSQNFLQIVSKAAAGTEANFNAGEAESHSVARMIPPEAEAVIMELGSSQGLNSLSLQSTPIPDAPVSKPAQ